MKVLKLIAVAGILSTAIGTAQAADGYERSQRFQANFQAEQDRLWGDKAQEQEQQVVDKEKSEKKADS